MSHRTIRAVVRSHPVKFAVDPFAGFAVMAASPDTSLRIKDVIAARKRVIVAVEDAGRDLIGPTLDRSADEIDCHRDKSLDLLLPYRIDAAVLVPADAVAWILSRFLARNHVLGLTRFFELLESEEEVLWSMLGVAKYIAA
jgi:hypothetical protein